MSQKILCEKTDLDNIADTVRGKLGTSDTFYVSELSGQIGKISGSREISEVWEQYPDEN